MGVVSTWVAAAYVLLACGLATGLNENDRPEHHTQGDQYQSAHQALLEDIVQGAAPATLLR